jgi:O-antigen ligase
LSTYLVMFIPLCAAQALYEEKTTMKLVYWAGTMLAVGCLLVGQSRAGVLALFCEMIALAWLSKRRLMQIIAGVFCVTLLGVILLLVKIDKTGEGNLVVSSRTAVPVKVDTNSVIHRFDIWVFFLKQIAERPILGIGYGKETSKMLFAEVPEVVLPGHHSVREHGTHNILMEIALHVGLPGLGLFLWVSARFAQTVFAYHRLAEDPQAKAILLGVAVSTVGVGVRVLFDQMLVSTLAIQFGVLAALAMASSVSDEGRLAVEGR